MAVAKMMRDNAAFGGTAVLDALGAVPEIEGEEAFGASSRRHTITTMDLSKLSQSREAHSMGEKLERPSFRRKSVAVCMLSPIGSEGSERTSLRRKSVF